MLDPPVAAQQAGLVYVSDDLPGIRRRRCGRGWSYRLPDGQTLRDAAERARIEALAIPPAYTDVWICPLPHGHLQATGRDARGRKQYRYHPRWREARQQNKYAELVRFGEGLPMLRARLDADLRARTLTRDKVLAAAITLLDRTFMRVGNRTYTRANGSFGLTTLRDRHVDFSGTHLHFVFVGKHGKLRKVSLRDRRLVRAVRRCRDIPGYHLFQYYDHDGARQPIGSGDVNDYLKATMGAVFTAKTFRTWGGTVTAARCLGMADAAEGEPERRRQVSGMVALVADTLGNTEAVCRKHYIHPALITRHLDGTLRAAWQQAQARDPRPWLSPEEDATLHLLAA